MVVLRNQYQQLRSHLESKGDLILLREFCDTFEKFVELNRQIQIGDCSDHMEAERMLVCFAGLNYKRPSAAGTHTCARKKP